MKIQTILVLFFAITVVAVSCSKGDHDEPDQTIITSDSSGVSGRLYVEVYDVNGNDLSGATVSLFLSKEDMMDNLPLHKIKSTSSGRVDFGYILQGNYYVTGFDAAGILHDTTPAQIIPKRELTRKLYVK
jgi:ABC-type uncharacterized transport system YnjBCD substrate-binding protein